MGLLESFNELIGRNPAKPKVTYVEQGPRGVWKVTDTKRLVLFGQDYGNPTSTWTKEMLDKLVPQFMERIATFNAGRLDQEQMRILGLQVEPHVGLGLWINGDLTLDHLKSAIVDTSSLNPRIDVPGFFDKGTIPLEISRITYYDSWQFHVEGHPERYEVVRHIPDALAAKTGEQTLKLSK